MAKTATPTTAKAGQTNTSVKEMDSALLDFLSDELKDIYWAEKHLTKALPKMARAATSAQLKKAFETHLKQTLVHIGRLEKVFKLLEKKPQAKKCEAMAGIVKEGSSIIEDTDKGTATRDVGLILAAQKVEHYEISTYGGLAQLAETLGLVEVKNILGKTLDEEKATDLLLSELARNSVNYQSAREAA